MPPGASPLLPAQLPAPRLSPPFPSSVGSVGLCPRSRSSWQGACTRPQGAGHKLTPCSACLWSGGLCPAVGVEQRRPGRFPACFCSRDGSVPSHPTCSRLCGAVNTLRNGFVHPKLAWQREHRSWGSGAWVRALRTAGGVGTSCGWSSRDGAGCQHPSVLLACSSDGTRGREGCVPCACCSGAPKTDPVSLCSLPDSKGSLEPHKPGKCPAGTAASAHPLNASN